VVVVVRVQRVELSGAVCFTCWTGSAWRRSEADGRQVAEVAGGGAGGGRHTGEVHGSLGK
jgi:hypothetical protein